METALLSQLLGFEVIIVLEQREELDLVLQVAKDLNLRPILGLRAKLSTKTTGQWADTSGERGKFGLTSPQILQVVHTLKQVSACSIVLHALIPAT